MDSMSNEAAGYIFSQTGKQACNIFHFHNLPSYKEHDTDWGIPAREETRQWCSLSFWYRAHLKIKKTTTIFLSYLSIKYTTPARNVAKLFFNILSWCTASIKITSKDIVECSNVRRDGDLVDTANQAFNKAIMLCNCTCAVVAGCRRFYSFK